MPIASNMLPQRAAYFSDSPIRNPRSWPSPRPRWAVCALLKTRNRLTGNYTRAEAIAAIDADRVLPDMLHFDPSKPAKYPNGRSFTDDVIDHRLAFLSKGDIPPTGLRPHTDVLTEFPYLGHPHQKKS